MPIPPPPLAWLHVAPTAWVVFWIGLGAATVALVVLFRTRWRHVRPWRKCAVLSLWVHLLLACLAMTVRIVSGAPGEGPNDEPIQVAVLADFQEVVIEAEAETETKAETETPPDDETAEQAPEWEEAANPPLVAPVAPPLVAPELDAPAAPTPADEAIAEAVAAPAAPEVSPAPPLEAPPLLELPTPTETPPPAVAEEKTPESTVEEMPLPQKVATADAVSEATPEVPVETPPVADQTPTASPPPSPHRLPTEYAQRTATNRAELVRRGGGNAQTERAVRSALAWLAGAQSDDGRWNAARHGAGREQVVLGHNRQNAGRNGDTAVSGLALLAFLGSGHTHQQGDYAVHVQQGLDFLARTQSPEGALFGKAQFFARTYCHSMASFAVNEALAMTGDEQFRPVATAAVRYSLATQNPSDGGWRYRAGDAGDTSQLGWQLMALKSADLAGVEIPEATWTRIERFLQQVRRGQHGGLASYTVNSRPSRTMTAEAFFCRHLIASRYRGRIASAAAEEATDSLLRSLPGGGKQNLYYWYYATLALHYAHLQEGAHLQSAYPESTASRAWEKWNAALVAELLTSQNDDGSWPANTVWGGYGGKVYTTAMAALCLEVYYRYAPVEEPYVARRR